LDRNDEHALARGDLVNSSTAHRFPVMCALLHAIAQEPDPTTGPERGWNWERRIEREFLLRGFPIRPLPAGSRLLGTFSASGLRHQIDGEIRCTRAFVIGEWKAYTGPVPKNEVLRFKAVTDDYYEDMTAGARRAAILRVFAVSGGASDELRRYAARHSIALVERSRWPAPVLADPLLPWPNEGPPEADRRRLAWLSRPLQEALPIQDDGTMLVPPSPGRAAIDALLRLQERWSTRLDAQLAGSKDAYSLEQRRAA
jgi:hypothetical protein